MKRSRYSFLFDIEEGKALLFSAANGALAEIDALSYPRVKRLLFGDKPLPSSPEDTDLWNALCANGFLVDDAVTELSNIEKSSNQERHQGSCLSLTIAPTLACNFSCDYCFERQSSVRMTADTENALLRFAGEQLEGCTSLLVTWFGGEPTLCLPTIQRVQESLLTQATRRGVTLDPGSIITNGYLLNSEMATKLKQIGITTAQVTLDGPQATHDTRRRLRNGNGTFDRIIENVAESCDILNLIIRVNIDKQNVDSAVEVVQELRSRGLDQKVNVHFAAVKAAGETCSSVRDRCFTDEEFSHSLVKLYRKLFERGIFVIDYPEVFSGGHCGAVTERSYVIAPNGLLFRCWEELSLDSAKSVGNIFNDPIDQNQKENQDRYRAWNPFGLSECRACDILPICMGGCPLHGMENGDANRGACSPYKHNLREMLFLRYLYDARKEVTV